MIITMLRQRYYFLFFNIFSDSSHLIDVNKMVKNILTNINTCVFCLVYNIREILLKDISQQLLELMTNRRIRKCPSHPNVFAWNAFVARG